MQKLLMFSLALFLSLNLFCQRSNTDHTIDKTIIFDNESEESELEFRVQEGDVAINLNMESTIKKGTLEVKLIRPNGKKAGGFKLKTKVKSKKKAKSSNSSVSTNTSSNSDDSGTETFSSVIIMNESESGAKGNMVKVLTNPESGIWKVKISPKSVTGELKLKIEW